MMAMRMFAAYNRVMIRHPALTQIGTTGVLVATGDVVAQKFIEKHPLDYRRTAKFAIFGLCGIGPALCVWIRFLERSFGLRKFALKPWHKVALDQCCFSPVINLASIGVLGVLANQSMAEIKKTAEEKYLDIMKTAYKIWPIAQVINFNFVPLNYRVIYISVVALIWNTYFTWKMSQ